MAFVAQRSAVTLTTSNWYAEKRMFTKKNGGSRSILGLLPWALLGGKVKREK